MVISQTYQKMSSETARVFVGKFYEDLFLAMFGGEKINEGNTGLNKPDVLKKEKKIFYEIKSSYKYNYYHLRDCQMNFFSDLLDDKDFHDFKLFFAFFTHKLKNISDLYKDKDDLFKNLAKQTESLLILPFNYIEQIHFEGKSRYDGAYYDNLTKLRRKDIRELLISKTIYEKTTKEFNLEGYLVNPFRITEVKN